MPARFRAQLGETFVITRGLHGCLWVFPEHAWPHVHKKLTPRSLFDDRAVKLQRYFLGAAVECSPDRQGRVAIPEILMDLAGIKCGESVWIMGLGDRVEIWSKARWQDFNAQLTDQVIAELGREVDGL